MKNQSLLIPIIILSALLIPLLAFPQYILEEGYISTDLFEKANANFTYKNLRIYPLIAGDYFKTAHSDIGTYTNLEEALKENKIRITEKTADPPTNRGDYDTDDQPANLNQNNIQQHNQTEYSYGSDGEVNALYIENISNDTIYLMAGEVVKGGKQDRVLAQDIILSPGSGRTEIPVFCVEPNRWSYASSDRSFNEYFTVTSNSVRGKAVMAKDQHQVWDAVEEVMERQGTQTSTGTYTALESSEDYNTKLNEYAEYFEEIFSKTEDCIGFVAVTGDLIIGCDIFATPELFEIQRANILNAYVTEAVTRGGEIEISDSEVLAYLAEFLSTEAGQDEVIGEKGMQYKFRDKKIHVNTY
jgi:hypothetical protein